MADCGNETTEQKTQNARFKHQQILVMPPAKGLKTEHYHFGFLLTALKFTSEELWMHMWIETNYQHISSENAFSVNLPPNFPKVAFGVYAQDPKTSK